MKSGNYLSSQQYPASTFGVKELNFCVRYGNRWVLFAIITAIAISTRYSYLAYILPLLSFPPLYQGFIRTSFQSPFKKINNYIAITKSSHQLLFFLVLVKIIDFLSIEKISYT